MADDYVIVTVTGDGRRRQGVVYVQSEEAARAAFKGTWEGAPNAVQGTLLRVRGKAMTVLAGAWWADHRFDRCECGHLRGYHDVGGCGHFRDRHDHGGKDDHVEDCPCKTFRLSKRAELGTPSAVRGP